MDFCFVLIGCSKKYSQGNPEAGTRVCPRCNNAAVNSAKSRTWLELFCIPVVPLSSKEVWVCSICSWEVKKGNGFEPPYPGQGGPQFGGQQWGGPPPQQWGPPQQQWGQPSGTPPMQYGQPQYNQPGQFQQPGYGNPGFHK